ncbi:hypothetical protein CJU89_4592 [Yarrowia sp. B02]|nr:hypothetical protein CJU89_4592 [Yarrowia sp. B02]
MSSQKTPGWMKKTAYISNIFLNDQVQWDWKGVSAVDFWIPVKSRWTSYADFAEFFHAAEPAFKLQSHYRISALPEPLVGCEPLLACCQGLPLTFVMAKKWYIYEQPPENDPSETIASSQQWTHMQAHIRSLEAAVEQLTTLTVALQRVNLREAPVLNMETRSVDDVSHETQAVQEEESETFETESQDLGSQIFETDVSDGVASLEGVPSDAQSVDSNGSGWDYLSG